jgi:hypothetical protein
VQRIRRTDALVEAARKECRSTHFVLIDAYQDLPDDFMLQALATPRDGKSGVLGYVSTASVARRVG